MSKVLGFDHVSIIVKDADAALRFYQTLLGLPVLMRPDLGFPGYWLDLQSGQSLHLMEVANPNQDTQRPAHGGRDYHFALRVSDIEQLAVVLEREGASFTRSRSGRKALFIKDLDNNAFELFEAS